MRTNRRTLLVVSLAAPTLAALLGRSGPADASDLPLPPTPSCGAMPHATPRQTPGPFYTPDAPLKHDLRPDAPAGKPLLVAGLVLDRRCRPIAGARVEIWHADEAGRYDNDGFRLRGHQIADAQGRWGFRTIVPSLYPGRTAHYHLRVQRPDGPALVTQLYFPDHPRNAGDFIFDPRLLLAMQRIGGDDVGRYDFVLG